MVKKADPTITRPIYRHHPILAHWQGLGSDYNKRGYTVQEFLAPTIVLFYQQDWTLYLNDHTPNYKESIAIMQELGYATGINARALVAFRPGMRNAREKLQ